MIKSRVLTTCLIALVFGTFLQLRSAWASSDGLIIATGDTTHNSTVLWACSEQKGVLTFEISTEQDFSNIIQRYYRETMNSLVPVKLRIINLEPSTRYYYKVSIPGPERYSWIYRVGTFVTSDLAGTMNGLRFGVSGDWQQAPPYPSISNVPFRKLDFFIKLGDTIYADLETPARRKKQARYPIDFFIKQKESVSGRQGANFMASLYQSTSILATIDDHEVVDNVAGGAKPGESPDAPDVNPDEPPLFTDSVDFVNQTWVYRWAMKAFQAFHPLVNEFWDAPEDDRVHSRLKIYRYVQKGSDAAVFVLDTRTFRDAQLPPVEDPTNPAESLEFLLSTFDSERTLLGLPQLTQLMTDLLDAQQNGITWKFVVVPEPIQNFGVVNAEDRFEGYASERTALLKFIDDNQIDNVVFLSADFHGSIVNNLAYQSPVALGSFIGIGSTPVAAFEIVSGPVAFFSGRFGPAVVNIGAAAGLITEQEKAFYDTLPVLPDADSIPNDKDDFVKGLVNAQLEPLNYDPVGLNENLPQADGLISAELISGDYLAVHNFTWTEFDIDAETQELKVTIWGIEAHSEQDFLADPVDVTGRFPKIICQFVVHPN